MDAELKKEIDAAVEKSLPKQIGDALQKRLSELESKERQLVAANSGLEKSQKDVEEQRAQVAELSKLVATDIALQKREREIAARELRMEVFELDVKLKASEASNDKVLGFVGQLMRNTEFRKNTFLGNDHHFRADGGRDSAPTGGSEETEAH